MISTSDISLRYTYMLLQLLNATVYSATGYECRQYVVIFHKVRREI
jgi:hypothetical protein